ncbi:hypothetical protein SETIT_2G421100v2 [Setaria italica]|uniref:Uncharacterized protein n=1 Tax=Setaria italica TaxID=4555 RepID=A0A368Q8S0_SETIT|nr:hypothetical protein SETIT_2G421100v2 [Setaria italica]
MVHGMVAPSLVVRRLCWQYGWKIFKAVVHYKGPKIFFRAKTSKQERRGLQPVQKSSNPCYMTALHLLPLLRPHLTRS